MKQHFERNLNIFIFKELLHQDFKFVTQETFLKIQNEKLFTSYIDVNKKDYCK